MLTMRKYKVYALSDDSGIRYIGYTGNTIDKRLKEHLKDKAKNQRTNWIKSAIRSGSVPKISILFDDLSREEALSIEISKIKEYREKGIVLVNGTAGGEGGAVSQEARMKISAFHKGKPRSEKDKQAISRSLKGKRKPAFVSEFSEGDRLAIRRKIWIRLIFEFAST